MSSYSAVRFLGGAIAPPLATTLADSFTAATPYYVAGGSVLAATLVVALGHRALRRVNDGAEAPAVEAQSIAAGAVA